MGGGRGKRVCDGNSFDDPLLSRFTFTKKKTENED
jgi:hypothetical protein